MFDDRERPATTVCDSWRYRRLSVLRSKNGYSIVYNAPVWKGESRLHAGVLGHGGDTMSTVTADETLKTASVRGTTQRNRRVLTTALALIAMTRDFDGWLHRARAGPSAVVTRRRCAWFGRAYPLGIQPERRSA